MFDTYLRDHFWTFRLFTLVAAAWLVAKVVSALSAALLEGPALDLVDGASSAFEARPPALLAASDVLRAFLDRNLFHARREELAASLPDPDGTPALPNLESCTAAASSALRATLVAREAQASVAVFSDPVTAETAVLRVGDALDADATLMFVDARRAAVNRGGRCELYTLDPARKGDVVRRLNGYEARASRRSRSSPTSTTSGTGWRSATSSSTPSGG